MNDFLTALKKQKAAGRIPVIPDIKCFSPKEGDLMHGRDPVLLAKTLADAGACVLSVVTEGSEFHGSLDLLKKISGTVPVPVLRKDFLETTEDLRETKEAGASAVLLMYSCLGKEKLTNLYRESLAMDLLPFVETHNAEELQWAAELDAPLVGINNRDILQLERDDGDVSHAAGLLQEAPEESFVIVESGLMNGYDVRKAVRHGADAALVGTAILQDPNPAAMFRAMSRPCNLKICGLMTAEGIDLCLQHHVDIAGFVTEYPVEVPWNLSRERTMELLSYLRSHGKTSSETHLHTPAQKPPAIQSCIVTGGTPGKVIRLAEELRPDFVQLHYTETLEETARIVRELHTKQIRVIRSIPSDRSLRVRMFGTADIAAIASALEKIQADMLLLDSRDAENAASGGSAILQNKAEAVLLKHLSRKALPLMVGGGVTAANLSETIHTFSPDAVDIMTGSETGPGQKSGEMIRQITDTLYT